MALLAAEVLAAKSVRVQLPLRHRPQRLRVNGGEAFKVCQLTCDIFAEQGVSVLSFRFFLGNVFFQDAFQLTNVSQPDDLLFLSHVSKPPFS